MSNLLPSLAIFLALAAIMLLLGFLQTKQLTKPATRRVDGDITWHRTYPGVANYIYIVFSIFWFLFSVLVVFVCIGAALQEYNEDGFVRDLLLKGFLILGFSLICFLSLKAVIINVIYYIVFSEYKLLFNSINYGFSISWSDIDQIKLESSGLSRILLKNGDVVKFASGYAGIVQFYDMAILKAVNIQGPGPSP